MAWQLKLLRTVERAEWSVAGEIAVKLNGSVEHNGLLLSTTSDFAGSILIDPAKLRIGAESSCVERVLSGCAT